MVLLHATIFIFLIGKAIVLKVPKVYTMHTRPKKSRDTQKTTPSLYLQPNQSIKSNKGNELDPKCTSKIIWNSCVQPKLSFFAWEALWGKVLTLNCLQKRGCALSNRCFLCQMFEGSIDHLLLHCEKTREVWMLLLSLFGVSWVFPFSVKETLLGWRGSFVGKKRKVCGKWDRYVCFGPFERQGIKLPLKIVCCPTKGWKLLLCIYYGRIPNCG